MLDRQVSKNREIKARQRFAQSYLRKLNLFSQEYREGDKVQALSEFERDWDQIQHAQSWTVENKDKDQIALSLCSAYADAGWQLLELVRSTSETIRWLEPAVQAARQSGQRYEEGQHLGNLGIANDNMGKHREAIEYFMQALEISRALNSRPDEVHWLHRLGKAYRNLGDHYSDAENYYKQAAKLAHLLGDQCSEGRVLIDLGNARANQGFYHEALNEYYKVADELISDPDCNSQRDKAILFGYMGNAFRNLGQFEQAVQCYQNAIRIDQEIGDRKNEGLHAFNLGLVYRDQGQFSKQNREVLEQALEIAKKTGDERSQGKALNALGTAFAYMGEFEQAIKRHLEGLKIIEEINANFIAGYILEDLGKTYLMCQDYEQAITSISKSLDIANKRKHTKLQQTRCTLLAQTYLYQGNLDEAMKIITDARQYDTAENTGTSRPLAAAIQGLILARNGNCAAAIDAFDTSLEFSNNLVENTPGYSIYFAQGIALTGLALLDSLKSTQLVQEAKDAFLASIDQSSNLVVANDLRPLLKIFRPLDKQNVLEPIQNLITIRRA